MKNSNIYSGLAVVWGVAIGTLSLLPAGTAVASPVWDKLEHALAFLVLALLTGLGNPAWPRFKVWLIAVSYGVAIEFGQGLSPGRHPDPMDALANAVGALIAVVGLSLMRRRQ